MERIVVKSDESQDLNEDCSIVSWNFDCPTDEILITSSASSPGAEARPTRMASARLATQSLGVGNGAGGDSASPEPERENPRDLIVIPATANSVQLQHAIQQVSSGGVTVLDVRGLQAGDSSGQSSPGGDAPGTVLVQAADGGHFITVSGDAGGVGYHVQYVEPQELYTQSQQAQMDPLRTYPVYTVSEGAGAAGGTLYAGAQWAGGGGSAAPYPQYLVAGAALDEAALPGQHRGVSPETVAEVTFVNTGGEQCVEDGDENGLGAGQQHAMRTPPATVQWLVENYETAEGVSLPRSTLYAHYLRHCTLRDLEPVNAASFGKLIRSVFLGLRTRRLGTRGNSKYHYYGIRIKPGSVLAGGCDNKGNISGKWNRQQTSRSESDDGSGASGSGTAGSSTPHQHQQYLGDASLPDFPDLELPANEMPPDCTIDDVDTLKVIYREHCEAFLEAVLQLELGTVEQLWREFWRQHTNDDCEEEKFLSKWKLYQLCACNEVQLWLRQVDVIFYQRVVEVLLPDVLRPIPSSLTQAIRNFAKGLEQWLSGALNGCPAGLVAAKSGPAAALAASLRRYTSLNHLAQAARAVLHNAHQVHQMLADLNRVDFRNVQEQAAWVCQCGEAAVAALEADFKATLGRAASLEQWAAWLEGAVVRALRPHERRRDYAMRARQFLLKWSFYSSMVIRDLTLRSAASFGSFHLIRLLYDEYMFYLVEQRVAAHSGRAPIAVMAEVNFDDPIIVNVNDVKKRNRDLDDVWIQDWDKEKGEGSDNGQGDGSPPEKKNWNLSEQNNGFP